MMVSPLSMSPSVPAQPGAVKAAETGSADARPQAQAPGGVHGQAEGRPTRARGSSTAAKSMARTTARPERDLGGARAMLETLGSLLAPRHPGAGAVSSELEGIIHDPSLSIEEKIVLVAATIQGVLEGQLEDLLEIQAKGATGSSRAGASMNTESMVETVGAAVGGLVGALAAGPAGATAGVGIGGAVGKMAYGLAGSRTGASGPTDTKVVEARIQLLLQRLNRAETMLSNMLQAIHQTKRAVVSNIRV